MIVNQAGKVFAHPVFYNADSEITGEHSVFDLSCVLFIDAESDRSLKWHVPVSTWTNPNMTEDWDEGD